MLQARSSDTKKHGPESGPCSSYGCYARVVLEALGVAEVRDATIRVVQIVVETNAHAHINRRHLVADVVNTNRQAGIPRCKPVGLQIMKSPCRRGEVIGFSHAVRLVRVADIPAPGK